MFCGFGNIIVLMSFRYLCVSDKNSGNFLSENLRYTLNRSEFAFLNCAEGVVIVTMAGGVDLAAVGFPDDGGVVTDGVVMVVDVDSVAVGFFDDGGPDGNVYSFNN